MFQVLLPAVPPTSIPGIYYVHIYTTQMALGICKPKMALGICKPKMSETNTIEMTDLERSHTP